VQAYFKKNPKAKAVKKAVEMALAYGGAMNFAIKEIEKLKKGLSKHPEVKKALRWANFGESIARDTFKKIVTENYTKNFNLLCNSIKLNKVQQKILDSFINHGTIKNQYIGRVAGRKKETKIFAAKKKFTGSIENRKEALMQALKVNTHQKSILDAYLKTGRVIGKYAGSIAGSTKTTKNYSGFRGFKESYDLLEGYASNDPQSKANEDIQENISLGRAGIKKDFPNVWAQKDDRMNQILMGLVNLHGFVDNLKSYKKNPKKFVDSLKRIGKDNASLKKAGLSWKTMPEGKNENV